MTGQMQKTNRVVATHALTLTEKERESERHLVTPFAQRLPREENKTELRVSARQQRNAKIILKYKSTKV